MKNIGIILIGFYVKGNPMTNFTEVARSEKIDRLGVYIELHGDGHGFFHIVYKADDNNGGYCAPLTEPIRCPIKAAAVFERELNLANAPRH